MVPRIVFGRKGDLQKPKFAHCITIKKRSKIYLIIMIMMWEEIILSPK